MNKSDIEKAKGRLQELIDRDNKGDTPIKTEWFDAMARYLAEYEALAIFKGGK